MSWAFTRARPPSARLWLDVNWSADRNGAPDLLDFLVRDGDASLGPIEVAMGCSDPRLPGRKPVNHDVATGRDAERACSGAVRRIRIRDAQCAMIVTVGLPCFDAVDAFGRAPVAKSHLVADRSPSQRDEVLAYEHAVRIERQLMLGLLDDDAI